MQNAYWDNQQSVNTLPSTAQNLEGHHNFKMIIDQEVGLGYLPISIFEIHKKLTKIVVGTVVKMIKLETQKINALFFIGNIFLPQLGCKSYD